MKSKILTLEQQRARIAELAEMKPVRINKQINTSIPAILKQIRHRRKKCEDCRSTVKNRVLEATMVFWPVRHWIQKCRNCKNFLNHKTGKYEFTWQQAHSSILVQIGYFRKDFNKTSTNSLLSVKEQQDLQLYRNQLQSLKAAEQPSPKKNHKLRKSKDSE